MSVEVEVRHAEPSLFLSPFLWKSAYPQAVCALLCPQPHGERVWPQRGCLQSSRAANGWASLPNFKFLD